MKYELYRGRCSLTFNVLISWGTLPKKLLTPGLFLKQRGGALKNFKQKKGGIEMSFLDA